MDTGYLAPFPIRPVILNLSALALACMLFATLFFQVACGGGGSTTTGSKGTPTGTYTITVTGAYSTGSVVHSTPTTLKVQ